MTARSPPTTRRRGTTLIEALLGLVVVSTLLVTVALARGRFLRQWADADRRLADCRAADALIAGWVAGPPSAIPLDGRGSLAPPATATWRTHVVRSPAAATLAAVVVRLDLFDRPAAAPTVSVDFLVHDRRAAATGPVAR